MVTMSGMHIVNFSLRKGSEVFHSHVNSSDAGIHLIYFLQIVRFTSRKTHVANKSYAKTKRMLHIHICTICNVLNKFNLKNN